MDLEKIVRIQLAADASYAFSRDYRAGLNCRHESHEACDCAEAALEWQDIAAWRSARARFAMGVE
jgi:ribosome modulation factor